MSPGSSHKGCSVLTSFVGHTAAEHPSSHRNKDTTRDEFIFYSKRLMRLLIEHALSFLPLKVQPWPSIPIAPEAVGSHGDGFAHTLFAFLSAVSHSGDAAGDNL